MLHNNKDFAGTYMYSDTEFDYSVVNSKDDNHSFTRYFGTEPGEYESYPLMSLPVNSIMNTPSWVKKLLKQWIEKNPSCMFIDKIILKFKNEKNMVLNEILEIKDKEKLVDKEVFVRALSNQESYLMEINIFLKTFETSLVIARSKDFFREMNTDDIKRLSKKLKESAKEVRNGKQRKFFTSASEYVLSDDVFDFITLQTKYFYEKYNKVKQDSLAFLYNDEEAEKAGWNSRKPNEKKLLEWADKAYPSAKSDIWDVEFEQILFDSYLASLKED